MKGDVSVRRANIKDLGDVLRLNFELFKKEFKEYDKSLNLKWTYSGEGKKYFKSRIIGKDGLVEVAEIGGKVIGYLCGGISKKRDYRKNAKYAELENMFIEKKYRGGGIGAKLTKGFMSWCKKNKVDYVAVGASTGNKQAIDFYRKFGFKDYDLVLEIVLRRKK